MRIHYFSDAETATTFTFENEEGVDDVQEMDDFTQWLSSVNTNFMKLKIKNNKSFNTYVVVAKDSNGTSESYDIVNENVEEMTQEDVVVETVEEDTKKKKKKKEKKTNELDE